MASQERTVPAEYLPILVTGASGQLAALVIKELLERGVPPSELILTTRTPEKLSHLSAMGAQVRFADHDQPDTLPAAFAGARRFLLISGPPEAFLAGIRVKQHEAAINAAAAGGAEHLFYTSAPHVAPDTLADAHIDHWESEQMVKQSGMKWTILRHWEWPDWHLEHHWRPAVDHGTFYAGQADGRISHVTREDTAAADAGALLSDDVEGHVFDITGPQALTAADIVAALRQASGKDIDLVQLEPQEQIGKLREAGGHPDTAPVFAGIAAAIRNGKYDGVSDDPEKLSGRRRKTIAEWLESKLPEVLSRPAPPPWN